MDNSVIKTGVVSVQKKRGPETIWVRKYCELHKKTDFRQAYLQLVGTPGQSKGTSIEYVDVRFIQHEEDETSANACVLVEVTTKRRTYLLKPQQDDILDWLFKLISASEIESDSFNNTRVSESESANFRKMISSSDKGILYDVEVIETDLAERCGIVGQNTLIICKKKFMFVQSVQDPSFSFRLIQLLYRNDDIIDVTTGRESKIGEGIIIIRSKRAIVLYRIVRVLMHFEKRQKLTVKRLSLTYKDDTLEHLSWFHGFISRERTTQLLKGQPEGTFLVRRSQSSSGDYVLSFVHNGLAHILIRIKQGRYYIVGEMHGFDSLKQIVMDCTKNPHSLSTDGGLEMKWKLKMPVVVFDKVPKRKLDEKEYSTLSMTIGQGWEQIGFQLGLNKIEIDHVDMDNHGVVTKINEMLLKWDQKEGDEATLDVLVKAISKCRPEFVSVDWCVLTNGL